MNIFERVKNKIQYEFKQKKRRNLWKNTDFFVFSFPKSGRTWVRVFLGKYLSLYFGEEITDRFDGVSPRKEIPTIHFAHRGFWGDIEKKERKGGVSVENIRQNNVPMMKGENVVFLARDPRDVVISHYFSVGKRSGSRKLKKEVHEMSLSEFIRHPNFGINNIVDYMNVWYEGKNIFNTFHLIKYEECKENPEEAFSKLVSFLKVPVDKEKLQEAISFASFSKMRAREEKGESNDKRLSPANTSDTESYKTRKGEVGGYEKYLSEQDIVYVNTAIKKLNKDFKYV